jgi:hypothetical protein
MRDLGLRHGGCEESSREQEGEMVGRGEREEEMVGGAGRCRMKWLLWGVSSRAWKHWLIKPTTMRGRVMLNGLFLG